MRPAGGEGDERGELEGREPVDVLIVSLGSTHGLRMADEQLQGSLQQAGAKVALARARVPISRRTLMLTDLAWARAARVAAQGALAAMRTPPRAVIYSSSTAALLWPRPGAIRFDAPSAGNRPGRHGLWQRPLERRRLGEASLLLPWSEGAMSEVREGSSLEARTLVLPVAVAPSGPREAVRDIAAMTYAANPSKKGLDRVLEAWREVRTEYGSRVTGELLVTGVPARELERGGMIPGDGVRLVGALAQHEYRALLRRTRVFVTAPRREDYGIAQLEALVDGCQLVTTAAPGPYAALSIARNLDSRLVGDDLAGALRVALTEPSGDYCEMADRALAAFAPPTVEREVAERVLPRLLGVEQA